MKLKKLLYMIPLAAIVVAAGCRKSQFNINQNTNSPTDSTVTYDVVLPAALHATGANVVAIPWGTTQNWMGYWARSGTYAPNVEEETYEITTTFNTTIWNACYDNNYDYQIVQTKAAKAGAGFYEGIARIMKAHNFQVLVDVHGNVPYSEALKGGANPTPKYDNGLDIYKDLLKEITEGMRLIRDAAVTKDNPNKDIWKNDIMFGNPTASPANQTDINTLTNVQKLKWLKFGNTLKLRLLIHAYAVPGINKAAEIAIIDTFKIPHTSGVVAGYLGIGENAQVQPGYAADKPNPFYNTYIATTTGAQTAANVFFRANKWGIEYYKYNGDPRLNRIYVAGSGGMVGVPYGLPPITANSASVIAGIGPGVGKTSTSPQCIISSSESFFLQAEARLRGFISTGDDVQTLMTNGINESFAYLGAGSAASYISGNAGYSDVDVTAAGNTPGTPGVQPLGGIYTVLSQKWFALNGISTLEIWTDYRRVPYKEVRIASTVTDHFVYGAGVGFEAGPTISVAPQNTSTKIPVRFLYPQTEYNYNAANVASQGTIDRYSRIFWDLN